MSADDLSDVLSPQAANSLNRKLAALDEAMNQTQGPSNQPAAPPPTPGLLPTAADYQAAAEGLMAAALTDGWMSEARWCEGLEQYLLALGRQVLPRPAVRAAWREQWADIVRGQLARKFGSATVVAGDYTVRAYAPVEQTLRLEVEVRRLKELLAGVFKQGLFLLNSAEFAPGNAAEPPGAGAEAWNLKAAPVEMVINGPLAKSDAVSKSVPAFTGGAVPRQYFPDDVAKTEAR